MNRLHLYKYFAAYLVMVALLGLYLVFLSTGESKLAIWQDTYNQGTVKELQPGRVRTIDEDTKAYYITLNYNPYGASLIFYSNHQVIKVYSNNTELIYNKKPSNKYLNTTGSAWNIVPLRNASRNLRIEVRALYKNVRNDTPSFYMAYSGEGTGWILQRCLPGLYADILIITFGVLIIIFWAVARNYTQIDSSAFYFGIFTIALGFWTLKETDAMDLLMIQHATTSVFSYVCLMLMPVPMTLFVKSGLFNEDRFIWKILYAASFVVNGCLIIFQMAGVMDLKESVIALHLLVFADLLYLIIGIINDIRLRGLTSRARTNLIGITAFTLSIIARVIIYYLNRGSQEEAEFITKLAMLLYLIIMLIDIINDIIQQMDKGRKAVYFEEMATHDVMTGLFSRMAFESDRHNMKVGQAYLLVSFDLNNLKQVNDTYGHKAGDEYITSAANILREIFPASAKCYRMGGDEFAALTDESSFDLDEAVKQMHRLEDEYNARKKNFRHMQIAYGSSRFVYTAPNDLEKALTSADALMYEKKKEQKAARTHELTDFLAT
ncbi:MAG: GGDEF domain-containing protein [Eubacteriales bacterium]|jgi:diguanylate cyclase (GGDEF)-like protein